MKPKRILIVSTYFPPEPSIASLRAYSYAKYWAKMGHDVTVLTTKKYDIPGSNLTLPLNQFEVIEIPYFNLSYVTAKSLRRLFGVAQRPKNRPEDYDFLNGEVSKKENPYFLVRRFIKNINSLFGVFITDRMPDVRDPWIFSAARRAKYLIESKGIHWIFSSYAPPASHIVAGILSKRYACRWIADYRDLWLENHVWVGRWPFTALEKYLENKYVGCYADILTTVSEPLAEVLRKKFSIPVHVIENGYDEDDYTKGFSLYFNEEKKRIVYTGTIYPGKRDPSPLFAALLSLVNESENMRQMIDHRLEILFYGRDSEWLENLIRNYDVQRWVKCRGLVEREDVLRIQNQADILLFLEWEDCSVDGILTGKLFEYLAMKKPVLGIGVSSKTTSGALIEEAGVGLAAGQDIDKIRCVLRNLIEGYIPFPTSPKDNVIQRYTRKKQAERVLEIMEQS